MCGFRPPSFSLSFNFRIPALLPSITFPPRLSFALALNCDLSKPFTATFGGGRVVNIDPNQDDEFGSV